MAKQDIKNPETKVSGGEKKSPASAPVLTDKTIVSVKSLVSKVFYTCDRTFESFAWYLPGDRQDMSYLQLKIMKMKHPRYFTEKWIIPEDATVIEKLGLSNVYRSKVNKTEKRKFYGDDVVAVREILTGLDETAKAELRDSVIADVKNGKIENVKIIRLLEKQLEIDLMQYI